MTEAILYPSDYQEIAALPSGARNDKVLAATQSPRREGALLEENLKFVVVSVSPRNGETPRETIRR